MGVKIGIALVLSFVTATGGALALSSGVPSACGGSAIDSTTAAQLGTVAGYSGDQLVNASDVMAAATAAGIDAKGQAIAVMAAMAQSGLVDKVASPSDPDVGLFNEPDSWGSAADRADPYKSSTLFFTHLISVSGWEQLDPGDAVQQALGNGSASFYTPYLTKAASVVTAIDNASASCASRTAGDDYPWANETPDSGVSPLGYYYGECVDFVAWRLNRDAGVVHAPWLYTWSNLTPLGGNAIQWKADWKHNGWQTSSVPEAGAVAWWGTEAGPLGHVAYVQAVNPDGTVTIEEYNWGGTHKYDKRVVAASSVGLYLYPPTRG